MKYFCRSKSQFSFKEIFVYNECVLLFVKHRAMIKVFKQHSQLSLLSRTHFNKYEECVQIFYESHLCVDITCEGNLVLKGSTMNRWFASFIYLYYHLDFWMISVSFFLSRWYIYIKALFLTLYKFRSTNFISFPDLELEYCSVESDTYITWR